MIEVYGNLWTHPAETRVITTNGTVKKDGTAVMGRGCALEAKEKWPGIEVNLGDKLSRLGNHVFVLHERGPWPGPIVISFPVKHQWSEKADYQLILQSAKELVAVVTALDIDTVVMPRPGCGNGGLEWEAEVPGLIENRGIRYILAPILDDRFHVITYSPEVQ